MDIYDYILHHDDIEELEKFFLGLSTREEKLNAIKTINQLKAKNKSYSDAMRLNYIQLQAKLMTYICTEDTLKNMCSLDSNDPNSVSEYKKRNGIIRKVVSLINKTYYDIDKLNGKQK